jgi:Ca2+-binding RTX toxin-like protein
MAFLTGFQVSLEQADLLGRASLAAFSGAPVPSGWAVVTPASLGLGTDYRDGNYYKDGDTGASAIVLRQGNNFVVAFRGTDDDTDVSHYPELYFGTYIDHYQPLLAALKAQAPAGAHFSFTGASLGGGATNNMAAIAQSAYGGFYADATFVAFASPNISNASGILNLGAENDPVYKSVPYPIWADSYQDYASSADNLVLANDEYVAGNGEQDMSAHSDKGALSLFQRFSSSIFYEEMSIDSTIVIAASDGLIRDKGAGREQGGAFYLGRDDAQDRMTGRGGNDRMEGFGGGDTLDGGAGNDKLDGGAGNDALTGDVGDDLFIYRAGGHADVITDFTAGAGTIDEITLVGLGITTFAGAMAFASQSGSNTVFDFGSGQTLTLNNVAMGSLVAGDFVFNVISGPNVAPTDIVLSGASVVENKIGAVIGNLSAIDPNGTTAFSYTVSDARFQIVTIAGSPTLKLANGIWLDFDTEPAVTLQITATDPGGLAYSEQFVIDVLDGPGFTITGTKLADLIDATHGPANQGFASDEADTIKGLAGNDTIDARGGNDIVDGGAGNDVVDGGDGDDTIQVAGSEGQFDIVAGGAGTDTLMIIGKSKTTVAGFDAGGWSIESLAGNGGALVGNTGANVFDFTGLTSLSGISYVDAGKGNDSLFGFESAEDLRGGDGNDILAGNAGSDRLTGGKGVDTFQFASGFGHDRITDFSATGSLHDVIVIDDALFADFNAVMASAAQVGKTVVVTLDANNSITFEKMTLAALTADDFTFV